MTEEESAQYENQRLVLSPEQFQEILESRDVREMVRLKATDDEDESELRVKAHMLLIMFRIFPCGITGHQLNDIVNGEGLWKLCDEEFYKHVQHAIASYTN